MLQTILSSESLALGGVSTIVWIALVICTLCAVIMTAAEFFGRKRTFSKFVLQTSTAYIIGFCLFPSMGVLLFVGISAGIADDYWTHKTLVTFLTGEFLRGFICYVLVALVLVIVISAAARLISYLLKPNES